MPLDEANVTVPPYVADIRAQPAALAALLDAGVPPAGRELLADVASFERVVLTGMGSSLHGMYPTFLRLAGAGVPVWCEETAELLAYHEGLTAGRTLLWITSQSGESGEVTELLDRLPRSGGPVVLAVTDDLDSALANRADVVMQLHSGPEHSVGTRSYVNTLAMAAMATSVALPVELPPDLLDAPQRIARYLDDWDEQLDRIGHALPEPPAFVLGRGVSLGSARTGALVLKEAAHSRVEAMSVPQFRHGPLDLADDSIGVVLLAGGPAERVRNEKMRHDLAGTGARCVWIDTDPDVEPAIAAPVLTSAPARPLGEIIPLQLLSIVLAERAGHEPGSFRQIDKVTRTL